jgi:hypothetical protein
MTSDTLDWLWLLVVAYCLAPDVAVVATNDLIRSTRRALRRLAESPL